MCRLQPLLRKDFEEIWNIMKESFPLCERRTYEGQKQVLEDASYHLYGCKVDRKIAAFFAVWEFERFAFVEHFAVGEALRNGGIGAKLLDELKERLGTNLILEVELPEEEMAKRRIGFYERNGFHLNGYSYVQPPLNQESDEIPLSIMSYPHPISKDTFEQVRKVMYRNVYKLKDGEL